MLAVIADHPGTNQTKIVEATGIDRSTLADIMKRLHDRGLVKRARDRRDARAYRVQLSPQGQRALEAAAPAERRAMDLLLSGLAPQQRKDIATLLEALVGITESRDPEVEALHRGSNRK